METVLHLRHGIPPTMPLPPATVNKLCFSSRRSSSLSLSTGHKKTLRGRVIECSNEQKLGRGASFKSTGAKLGALKSLLDVMTYLDADGSAASKNQEPTFDMCHQSVREFKIKALEMGPEKAIELLNKEFQKYHEKKETYVWSELDIALAEILICKGRFTEAMKRECLREIDHPSDLRFQLYKAIVHTMLASSYWQAFWKSSDIPDAGDIPIEFPK